ncbi:glycine--tRNA ligase subunit beta [Ramlibacter albus]|uniref:Glycine--tRNA ligase beta subunit n=1 Tax=Ramlibacter albus TaxID=2079448 RepID=A0A923M621_9BURK|nr:glycine--tRNA ligase subunit beta [Ramlibacter albus]MBC5763364.1 glycine--tRNA ligase subunit beta [Ramlibacter albus]
MSKNLLVELFVEELPPKALRKLGDAFGAVLHEQLKAQGLATGESKLTTFASPRRLAAHVTNVAPQAADKAVSQKLMPVSVGLDASGKPTPALLKKLQAVGADESAVPKLKRQMDGKAEALFYDSTAKGATLAEGLQKALNETIARLPIPKVMTYQLADGWTDVKFVRPAHSLVALHGADVVPVQTLGLQSGRSTQGHRFESKGTVTFADADSYAASLEKDGAVVAGFDARRNEIAKQLADAAAKVGGGAKAIEDDALLDEVTALVERPNVLTCEFEQEFLEVPQECLILTMKANQKYFPLLDAQGKLTNRFLVVSNIRPADPSAVVQGNERVVRPRLADAKFFFDQDRKKTLESRVAGLAKVVYHNKLGTQGERVERVRAIARFIGEKMGGDVLAKAADTAARLAKADLLTDMVGEFPELQGIMGRYYAQHDQLPGDIADAIEDHYKPRFAGDELPRNDVGIAVALADKLETLVGMFGIGNLPSGDKDPFALRRHALGVVRMLIERGLDLELPALVKAASDTFGKLLPDAAASNGQAMQFIYERIGGYLREQGWSPAEVEAVISVHPPWKQIRPRLEAVRAFAALPEAPALAAANKRIGNILKKSEAAVDAHVSEVLLKEDAEKALYTATQKIGPQARTQYESGDYTASLKTLAALREPVDAFFDGVMVNAEEADLRLNRLGLLATLHQAMNRVADLSRLAT